MSLGLTSLHPCLSLIGIQKYLYPSCSMNKQAEQQADHDVQTGNYLNWDKE